MRQIISLTLLSGLLLSNSAIGQGGDDVHTRTNVVYKALTEKGVPAGDKALKLPAPTMPDGLDKAGQLKVINALIADKYLFEAFTRDTPVTPHMIEFGDINAGKVDGYGRGIDIWFVAYGKFDALTAKNLQGQFSGGGKGKVTQLSDAELAKRKIKVKNEAELEEAYLYTVANILDRVKVTSTSHAMVSRTKDSIVLASQLDPRFAKDAAFPNQWRSLTLKDDKEMLGDPSPFESAGMYIKLTRLHEPAGAIFIEAHQVFVEPKKWFEVPNMLKAKLPIVIQSEVRTFRKELTKLK